MNPHVDVGAYLLGALDDAEMTAFEEHLAGCDECGARLDELTGVVPVLDELRGDGGAAAGYGDPPGDALLEKLLRQVAEERRRAGRRRLVAVAVAAVLVVGGPTVAVLATGSGGGRGAPVATATFAPDQRSASNPVTGASAVVGITDKKWGTAVDLRLKGVYGPFICSLIAVGRDGSNQTVATWSVPHGGYGTGAHPRPLTVHGAAGLRVAQISRFDVRTSDGKLLVSVPNGEQPPADRPRQSAG
ncbi:zf-HC2 domain-containing protein [Actinacidiphila sp. ITFR-21]|uniref:zf-HC2 domain-containing protein n=1 Tax=Actinacidiphila sp. ITFR-21 TaxID=3075199 RepID=UPI0028893BBE|nr:zf-HC2 domain-containing protein [Streptomyces sp. ITFR-21]WNI15266.1 zf-HC2 domain-containing protein [Streptomyces sp. ITFR-21]